VTDELDARLEARASTIVELLADRRLRRPRRLRSPEFRKNLERVYTAIRDTQRLRREGQLAGHHEQQLERLLLTPGQLAELNSDALGLILENVDQVLVQAADEKLINSLLEIEYVRDQDERGEPVPTWSTIHGDARPTALAEQKQRLSTLLRARHSIYTLRRAREGTRAVRLVWLAPILAGLIVAFILLADWISGASWRLGLLVAVAGAMGATVAAGRKLRGALARMSALRTFWYAFALQMAVGAVAGLFLWTVLESEVLDVGGSGEDWAVAVALAFAAGYSEPFLLKTIERITGVGPDEEK
jgi:hypothetical protein